MTSSFYSSPSSSPTPPIFPPLELLAPAGNFAAGCAALHYGADAVYLGLKKFSARADADNFSWAELSAFTAFAHSLRPIRKVYLTLNTLITQSELAEFERTLALLPLTKIDAVIVQDFGALHLIRKNYPDLPIHASTQMTVHNAASAKALADFGVKRITLARELSPTEIAEIAAAVPSEIEFFLHGALCYSYSGMCLFSSHLTGRSANRGRCCYPCRGWFDFVEASDEAATIDADADADENATRKSGREKNANGGYFFSMKDLSLAEFIPQLRDAGVKSLKIEGRKKSALYTAAVVDFYRRLLDGKITPVEIGEARRDLQTVFSRKLCAEFFGKETRGELIDAELVGHRGVPLGKIEKIISRSDEHYLQFRPAADLEVHDGLQFAIQNLPRPWGFAVNELLVIEKTWRATFTAKRGDLVAVKIPRDAPRLTIGAEIFHGSSQAVKRRYPLPHPQMKAKNLWRIKIRVEFFGDKIRAMAKFSQPIQAENSANGNETISAENENVGYFLPPPFAERRAEAEVSGEFAPTEKSKETQADSVRRAFDKVAEFPFAISALEIINDENRFAPLSKLNQLRRALFAELWRGLEFLIATPSANEAEIADDEKRKLFGNS